MEQEQIKNLVLILSKMKTLRRNGWLKRGIKDAETDAEHTFSLAVLTLLLAPDQLDQCKCLKLALVHDLPESFCGDFVPGEIDPKEKSRLERSAMERIAKDLGSETLLELFDEFLAQETPEAKFVKALGQLDNVFTARFYEDVTHKPLVREFWETAYPSVQKQPENIRSQLLKILATLS